MRKSLKCQGCKTFCRSSQWWEVDTPQGKQCLCEKCKEKAELKMSGASEVTLIIDFPEGREILSDLLKMKLNDLKIKKITIN